MLRRYITFNKASQREQKTAASLWFFRPLLTALNKFTIAPFLSSRQNYWENVQASTRATLFPCFISISRTSTAPTFSINFFNGLTLSAFDTRLVNQRHCDEYTWLSLTIFLRNSNSPPLHQSSAPCPPKFKFDAFVFAFASPRLRARLDTLRWVLFSASSCEAWKGGLHTLTSKHSPGWMMPSKIWFPL